MGRLDKHAAVAGRVLGGRCDYIFSGQATSLHSRFPTARRYRSLRMHSTRGRESQGAVLAWARDSPLMRRPKCLRPPACTALPRKCATTTRRNDSTAAPLVLLFCQHDISVPSWSTYVAASSCTLASRLGHTSCWSAAHHLGVRTTPRGRPLLATPGRNRQAYGPH